MSTKTLEFHRPSRNWIQVRCPCGYWRKDPAPAWTSRSQLSGFDYICDEGKAHPVDASTAARLRRLLEHPGWISID